MLKKVFICSVISLFVLGGAAISSMATEAGPAEITIGANGKKPAQFPHKTHQDKFKCADCHHGMGPDGKQVAYVEGQEIKECDSCHNKELMGGKTSGKVKLDSLKGVGHGNCLECHKEMSKADPAIKAKKITSCKNCHSK